MFGEITSKCIHWKQSPKKELPQKKKTIEVVVKLDSALLVPGHLTPLQVGLGQSQRLAKLRHVTFLLLAPAFKAAEFCDRGRLRLEVESLFLNKTYGCYFPVLYLPSPPVNDLSCLSKVELFRIKNCN